MILTGMGIFTWFMGPWTTKSDSKRQRDNKVKACKNIYIASLVVKKGGGDIAGKK